MVFKAATLVTTVLLIVHASCFKDSNPKTYTINLDLPPEQRWQQVAQDHAEGILNLVKEIKAMVPPGTVELVSLIGGDVEKYIPYPYNLEIVGITELIKGLTVGELILGNTLYEVTAFGHDGKPEAKACTSIIAETLNGTIYHARNLDYNFGNILRGLTIVVNFQKGGKTVYSGTTFAGMVGLLTGQKPHGYTITLDERNQGDWWMNALEALLAGTHGVSAFLIRDTLADPDMTFDEAVRVLADKPLIAPSYLIIGGTTTRQGAVITRDRLAAVDLWMLDAFNGRWFLVETNYDHWVPPPPDDNRRDPAISAMNKLTRNELGWGGLYNVLSTPPVLNNGTMYTVIMSADLPSIYTTWIRTP